MPADDYELIRLENMEEHGFGPEAMKQVRVCEKCGYSTSAKYDKCQKCGAPLPDETVYEKYKNRHVSCPDCDTVVSSEKKYCPLCGRKL